MNDKTFDASDDADGAGLSRSLKAAAEVPAPADLTGRVLSRPAFRSDGRTSFTRSRRTWSVVGIAAAVAAVAIGVTAVNSSNRNQTPSPASTSSPAASASVALPSESGGVASAVPLADPLLPRGDYQQWVSQNVPCAGAPAVADADQALLNPEVTVSSVVVCDTAETPVDGDGVWLMAGERELPAADVPALVEALTAENVPIDPAAMCTADFVTVPDFALVLDDGRVVRPGVPGDGCHPSRDVAELLAQPGEPKVDTPVRQLRSQAMVDAGCEPAGPSFWDPFSSGGTGTQGDRPAAAAAGGSLCVYESSGDSPETMTAELVSLGTPKAADLTKALDGVLSAQVKPAKECSSVDNAFLPAEDGWLSVVVPAATSDALPEGSTGAGTDGAGSTGSADGAAEPGATGPADRAGGAQVVLSVELGGCHRVLSADGVGWFAPGPAVDALAALADRPVVLK